MKLPDDDTVTMTVAELRALMTTVGTPNPAPAVEEGPHLDDPEVRAAKRRQLVEAGYDADSDGLTDDMRAVLRDDV